MSVFIRQGKCLTRLGIIAGNSATDSLVLTLWPEEICDRSTDLSTFYENKFSHDDQRQKIISDWRRDGQYICT